MQGRALPLPSRPPRGPLRGGEELRFAFRRPCSFHHVRNAYTGRAETGRKDRSSPNTPAPLCAWPTWSRYGLAAIAQGRTSRHHVTLKRGGLGHNRCGHDGCAPFGAAPCRAPLGRCRSAELYFLFGYRSSALGRLGRRYGFPAIAGAGGSCLPGGTRLTLRPRLPWGNRGKHRWSAGGGHPSPGGTTARPASPVR